MAKTPPTENQMDNNENEEEDEDEDEEELVEYEETRNRKITITLVSAVEGSARTTTVPSTSSGGSSSDHLWLCCQADECGADLRLAKRYNRRHRVCERHAKAPVVLVSGTRQRFCQQCSKFHELAQFDDTKRSCRERLASHNERRRKAQADPHFGSEQHQSRHRAISSD